MYKNKKCDMNTSGKQFDTFTRNLTNTGKIKYIIKHLNSDAFHEPYCAKSRG